MLPFQPQWPPKIKLFTFFFTDCFVTFLRNAQHSSGLKKFNCIIVTTTRSIAQIVLPTQVSHSPTAISASHTMGPLDSRDALIASSYTWQHANVEWQKIGLLLLKWRETLLKGMSVFSRKMSRVAGSCIVRLSLHKGRPTNSNPHMQSAA